MKPSVIVWDLETVPDLGGFAAANDLVGKSDVEVREAIGDKFRAVIPRKKVLVNFLHMAGVRDSHANAMPYHERCVTNQRISRPGTPATLRLTAPKIGRRCT